MIQPRDETARSGVLSRIRIVLARPGHPGNIGAAARAMKTMGIGALHLVAPERFPAKEAEWMATHAADVLAHARVHAALAPALEDCVTAYALSMPLREWAPRTLSAREAAAEAVARAAGGPVAFVFGNEAHGLANAETALCQAIVRIPTGDAFGSLNLAQAVQVMCYELFTCVAGADAVARGGGMPLATVADLEGLYGALDEAAMASGFMDPDAPGRLRERWRRLFSRLAIEREEVNILRGLLRALRAGPPAGKS